MSKVGVAFFNYVTFSDYGYKHANGIDGSCIRDNTIILPNTCSSGETSYMKSQGLVTITYILVHIFLLVPSLFTHLDIARLEVTFVVAV